MLVFPTSIASSMANLGSKRFHPSRRLLEIAGNHPLDLAPGVLDQQGSGLVNVHRGALDQPSLFLDLDLLAEGRRRLPPGRAHRRKSLLGVLAQPTFKVLPEPGGDWSARHRMSDHILEAGRAGFQLGRQAGAASCSVVPGPE